MWTCKKCNTVNQEHHNWCGKCNTEREYPFKWGKFLVLTLGFSCLSVSSFMLSLLEHDELYFVVLCTIYFIIIAPIVYFTKPMNIGIIAVSISIVLGLCVLGGYDELNNDENFKLYSSQITNMCQVIRFVCISGNIAYLFYLLRKDIMVGKKLQEEVKEAERRKKEEDIKKYGKITRTIQPYGYDPHNPLVRVFSQSKMIDINGRKIKFENIVDYRVNEYVSSEVYMSEFNMMKRGIIGGILYGKLGAIVGAATAEKHVRTNVDYTVIIGLKNGTIREVLTVDPVFVDKLCVVLRSIVNENYLLASH